MTMIIIITNNNNLNDVDVFRTSDELGTDGKSVILAAPFESLTAVRIFYNRYNRLVTKSHEIFGMHLVTVASDTGEMYVQWYF